MCEVTRIGHAGLTDKVAASHEKSEGEGLTERNVLSCALKRDEWR